MRWSLFFLLFCNLFGVTLASEGNPYSQSLPDVMGYTIRGAGEFDGSLWADEVPDSTADLAVVSGTGSAENGLGAVAEDLVVPSSGILDYLLETAKPSRHEENLVSYELTTSRVGEFESKVYLVNPLSDDGDEFLVYDLTEGELTLITENVSFGFQDGETRIFVPSINCKNRSHVLNISR